jgi:hypothetical protein
VYSQAHVKVGSFNQSSAILKEENGTNVYVLVLHIYIYTKSDFTHSWQVYVQEHWSMLCFSVILFG